MTSINYREQYIGTGTHVLRETLSQQASKAGYSIKLDAQFDDVTELEQEKLDKCDFPESLLFTVDVNLIQSKKAFLNFIKGLDDTAVYDQLWNLRPHNPHTYQAPIGKAADSYENVLSLSSLSLLLTLVVINFVAFFFHTTVSIVSVILILLYLPKVDVSIHV